MIAGFVGHHEIETEFERRGVGDVSDQFEPVLFEDVTENSRQRERIAVFELQPRSVPQRAADIKRNLEVVFLVQLHDAGFRIVRGNVQIDIDDVGERLEQRGDVGFDTDRSAGAFPVAAEAVNPFDRGAVGGNGQVEGHVLHLGGGLAVTLGHECGHGAGGNAEIAAISKVQFRGGEGHGRVVAAELLGDLGQLQAGSDAVHPIGELPLDPLAQEIDQLDADDQRVGAAGLLVAGLRRLGLVDEDIAGETDMRVDVERAFGPVEIVGIDDDFLQIEDLRGAVTIAAVEFQVVEGDDAVGITRDFEQLMQVETDVRRDGPFGEQAVGDAERDLDLGVVGQQDGGESFQLGRHLLDGEREPETAFGNLA